MDEQERNRRENHTCHAMGCKVKVPPAMFMCKPHWFALPKQTRNAVWDVYIPGQEIRMDPTEEYMDVTFEAIKWLAEKEGRI